MTEPRPPHDPPHDARDCPECDHWIALRQIAAATERAEGDIAAYAIWRRDPKRVTADDVGEPTDD